MLALLFAAQLSASVSLTGQIASQPNVRDREAFGVRYRTQAVGPFTVQAGVLSVSENGIANKTRAGVQHFALGAEAALASWWRTSLIYGNFDEVRGTDADATLRRTSYYRLWAVGNELHGRAGAITVERLIGAPVFDHAGLHWWTIRGRSAWLDMMAAEVSNSSDQAPYRFWVYEGTLHPFMRLGSLFKYTILTGGTRSLLDPHADRNVPIWFAALGLAWSVTLP